MPELRWALLGLGLLFLLGLALWEWRKSRRRHFHDAPVEQPRVESDRVRRIEPRIVELADTADEPEMPLEVPTIHPVEPARAVESLRVTVAADHAVDIPAAARVEFEIDEPAPAQVAIQWPREDASRILSLRVVHPRGEPLSGRALRIALDAAGLQHGPQNIYHLVDAGGVVLVSVANLMRPGNLDPASMDAQQFRGLNIFSVLPGPVAPERMLDELVGVARALAHRLGAVVQDGEGQDLDGVRLTQLQQSLDEAP
jgi:FtsZ-interacting cell division protein ZipA